MGSLQNLARGGRPGSGGLGGLAEQGRGAGGLGGQGRGSGGLGEQGRGSGGLPPMSGGLHSQGLQGRLTPTQFSSGGRSMGGLGGHSMGLLQSSVNNSRNPLFSRKMG